MWTWSTCHREQKLQTNISHLLLYREQEFGISMTRLHNSPYHPLNLKTKEASLLSLKTCSSTCTAPAHPPLNKAAPGQQAKGDWSYRNACEKKTLCHRRHRRCAIIVMVFLVLITQNQRSEKTVWDI